MSSDSDNILWLPQFKPCDKCIGGFIVKEVATKCECKIKFDLELLFIDSLLKANVIEPFSSEYQYTFLRDYNLDLYRGPDKDKNKEKIELYIHKFIEKYNSVNLFMSGEPGTQKSTIAKYILCSILRLKKSGYYIIANELFNILTDSERKEECRQLLQTMLQSDLLIIDEFDESKITLYSSDWKQKFILPFLKSRLETIHKATIFISNKTPETLGEKFEGAIQDLILRETESGLLTFNDKYAKYKEKINIKNIWADD